MQISSIFKFTVFSIGRRDILVNKKRLGILVGVLLVCVSFLVGCGSTLAYHKISAEEAKSMMAEGKPFIILDVRTEAEYQEKHIDGAILIPYDEVGSRAGAELQDKSALIFVYCRSGNRSSTAAHTLVDMGYINVYDMGAMADWFGE